MNKQFLRAFLFVVLLASNLAPSLPSSASAAPPPRRPAQSAAPQLLPGNYLFSAYGAASGRTHTAHVSIVPYFKPSITTGPSGSTISMNGLGFLPNEPVSLYQDWKNVTNNGSLKTQTFADDT